MLLHQTCYILKNLQSCYSALSLLRAHCSSNLIKEIIFYYFSHLSHYTLLSFSLIGVTSSLFSSFLFSHWSHFLSLFFIRWHPQLKTMVVVVVVIFFFFVLEVACVSDGGCFGWWCWFILMGFVMGCWWWWLLLCLWWWICFEIFFFLFVPG